jgi:GIY-YIG catalytic domain
MTESKRIAALLEKLGARPESPFPQAWGSVDAPDKAGVYVIRNQASKVMYVGRTTRAKGGLHQRLRNHLAGRSVFARELLPHGPASLRTGYTFQYLVVEKDRTRALLEQLATGTLCPKHLGLSLLAEKSDA